MYYCENCMAPVEGKAGSDGNLICEHCKNFI